MSERGKNGVGWLAFLFPLPPADCFNATGAIGSDCSTAPVVVRLTRSVAFAVIVVVTDCCVAVVTLS